MAYGGHIFYHFFTLFPTYMVYFTTFFYFVKCFFNIFMKNYKLYAIISTMKNIKKIAYNSLVFIIAALNVALFTSCESNPNSTLNYSPKEVNENATKNINVSKNYGDNAKDVVIFSTNDAFSSYNENLTYSAIKHFIDNFDKKNNYTTFVDTGNFTSGEGVAKLSKGKSSVEIMNLMDYDIVVPGSNDFDYGIDVFIENMRNLKADKVCCNMVDIKTNSLFFEPYVIYKYGDIKVAYIGVTSPEALFIEGNENYFFDENGEQTIYFFEDATGDALYTQIQNTVDMAIEAGADKVILLSHLGIENVTPIWSSTEVIAHTSGIDGVVDGHSKEVLENGLMINKNGAFIPLVEAGSNLSNVGVINIMSDGYVFPAEMSKNSINVQDENLQKKIDDIIAKFS